MRKGGINLRESIDVTGHHGDDSGVIEREKVELDSKSGID